METQPLSTRFVTRFLAATEQQWATCKINTGIYGFQFQQGTIWRPGLSHDEVEAYQSALAVTFPDDFVYFLRCANGTDRPTINVFGGDGTPHSFGPGVYSFPNDLEIVRNRIDQLCHYLPEIIDALAIDTATPGKQLQFIPIYSHRYVLWNGDPSLSPVCSIYGSDAIWYGDSLAEYLQREFLP